MKTSFQVFTTACLTAVAVTITATAAQRSQSQLQSQNNLRRTNNNDDNHVVEEKTHRKLSSGVAGRAYNMMENTNTLPFDSKALKQKLLEDQQDQQQRKTMEQTAVIHIGPQKTASSTIQHSMLLLVEEMKKDGYEIVPDVNFLASYSFAECFKTKNIPIMHQYYNPSDEQNNNHNPHNHHNRHRRRRLANVDYNCHTDVLDKTHQIGQRGNHLISSTETYSNPSLMDKSLKQFLDPYWKNVKIVVFYRRFYSWLVSIHNQHNKYLLPSKTNAIELVDWLTIDRMKDVYDSYYAMGTINRFKKSFSDESLKIYNYHNLPYNGDIVETFFCDAMPNANHTCARTREIKSRQTSTMKANTEQALVYKELAYLGREILLSRGKSLIDLNMKQLIHQVKYYQETTLGRTRYDFGGTTILCPDEKTLKWLLNQSLMIEYELFPEYYLKQGKDEIINEFNIYKTTKLCTVRGKDVLEHEYNTWMPLFNSWAES